LGFRRGFKTQANRIAVNIRGQMGLDPTAPIDPFAVGERFDIRVISFSDLDYASPFLGRGQSAFSAVTVPCGIDTAIVHNDAHHPTGSAATSVTNSRTAFSATNAHPRSPTPASARATARSRPRPTISPGHCS
jgi:hypothetical protein